MSVQAAILLLLSKKCCLEVSAISPDALFQDFGLDAVEVVDLTVELEEQLGIEIGELDYQTLTSLRSYIEYVTIVQETTCAATRYAFL